MATIRFKNVGITAISACVPHNVVYNKDLDYFIDADDLQKVIASIGIRERRVAGRDVCSSDLCIKAAEKLFLDNDLKESVDALIFVSQTPDYHMPATAPLIQHKLGLSTSVLSFDVNLACSGYVYGLSLAYSLASLDGIRSVLLLDGETMSKIVSDRDKESTPLFGDAGTATLVTKGDIFGESIFELNSDGSGSDIMKIFHGGYRHPSSNEGFVEKMDDKGNIRNGEQFFMDGMETFNFGMRVEPKGIKAIVADAGLEISQLDLIIYHQANKFMTDFFTKRLKFDPAKTPYSLDRYGNTSSASIPLTIVSELKDGYPNRRNVLLSGFGAGLSWGSVILDLSSTKISSLVEY